MNDEDNGRPVIRTFESIDRILIHDEQERLEYLIAFCLKNYYIGQSNMLSSGNYIPKWKHEHYVNETIKLYEDYESVRDLQVIVNGHRYKVK